MEGPFKLKGWSGYQNSPIEHEGTHPGPGKKGDKGYHEGHDTGEKVYIKGKGKSKSTAKTDADIEEEIQHTKIVAETEEDKEAKRISLKTVQGGILTKEETTFINKYSKVKKD